MFAAYVTVTILASVFNGIAAVTYLIGHDNPKAQADMHGRGYRCWACCWRALWGCWPGSPCHCWGHSP
jgi:hypothetical protein